MASFDLIGVGSPIMDLLARVPDEFLRSHVAGDKGGMVLVDADEMARQEERLRAGDNLILFPEGTSSDGNRTLPFKTALFSVAEAKVAGRPLTVQPVSVAYTRLDGMPLGRGLRPFYAWYGDMDLASHMCALAALGRLSVVVEFHPPTTIAAHGGRKELARHCHTLVSNGVAKALSGRMEPEPAASAA